MKLIFLIFSLAISRISYADFLPENAFSDDARGTTSAAFLKNIASARFSAMGQTGSTVEDIESIFYNPAGIDFPVYSNGFVLSYQKLLEESYKTDMAYIFKGNNLRYGFGLSYNSYGSFEKLNSIGQVYGSFSPYDYAFIYGMSGDKKNSSYGINFKFIHSDLIYEKAYSFAVDMGLIVHPDRQDKKSYSLVVRNLGFPMKLGEKSFPLPMEIIGGMKYPYSYNLNLLLDAKLPVDENPYLCAGLEWVLPFESFQFSLRTGANTRKKNGLGFVYGFSAGFGLNINGIVFDYSYVPYSDLGDAHKFTLNYFFGRFEKADDKKSEKEKELKENLMKNKKFAVLAFDSKEFGESYGGLLADNIEYLISGKKYKVISRNDINYIRLSKKIEFFDKSSILMFCRNLGVDYCIYGTVKNQKKFVLYNVNLLDTSSGDNLKSFSLKFPDEYKLNEISLKIVDECFE